jgi:hypothetical protein
VVDNRLSGSNTTTYSYDLANNLARASYLGNLQTTFACDSHNRLTGRWLPAWELCYSLGPSGHRTGTTKSSEVR